MSILRSNEMNGNSQLEALGLALCVEKNGVTMSDIPSLGTATFIRQLNTTHILFEGAGLDLRLLTSNA